MVYGLPQVKDSSHVYEELCKAKQSRKTFKHDFSMRSKEKIELVHSDVCGPFKVMSNGG